MATPGAAKSGLNSSRGSGSPSPKRGPRSENPATSSSSRATVLWSSIAPMVMASEAEAQLLMSTVPSGTPHSAALPTGTVTTIPSETAVSRSCAMAFLPLLATQSPTLTLSTSRLQASRLTIASSTPRMHEAPTQTFELSSTLMSTRLAAGAIPRQMSPAQANGRPSTMPAT